MTLETLRPDPDWDPADHREAVETLAALDEDYTFLVWGDDGCGDCQERLPPFAAALEAAGIADDRVTQYAVERIPDGSKEGPRVEEYDIGLIPTVVIERDGEELVRFEEEEHLPIAEYLTERLEEIEATA